LELCEEHASEGHQQHTFGLLVHAHHVLESFSLPMTYMQEDKHDVNDKISPCYENAIHGEFSLQCTEVQLLLKLGEQFR
jgi:hypothetical protein